MLQASILGKNAESQKYWRHLASQYANAISNEYHAHRLAVIDALIPKSLYQSGRHIFDFGCGDAVHFEPFLKAGACIQGVDIAPDMIAITQKKLAAQGFDPQLAKVGNVEALCALPSESLDAVFSFNVLAYLTDAEEAIFYREAARILKPQGYLVVTHSNELFDLYSLNRYTVDFFSRNFEVTPSVSPLLAANNQPDNPILYNIRENPLTYRYKLAAYGLQEVAQEFIHFHEAPPSLPAAKPKVYANTLNWPADQRWKLMFQCSTFGSCSQKRAD